MITDAILNAVAGFFGWILDRIPRPPGETIETLSGYPDQVRGVVDWIEKLAPVVPFSAIEFGLRLVLSILPFVLLYVGFMKARSLLTGGGGR